MKTLQQLLFCLDSYQEVVGSEEEMHKKAEVSPVRMLLENLQHLQGEVSWHFTCKSLNISNIDLSWFIQIMNYDITYYDSTTFTICSRI